ncbi:unnamed protein product [Allacma fusca]|uniref:Uncharacterized protein n=1 Tax=Allacma fusca TaxID=39272 RepID=A0A8J2KPG9_9HEXA|nr:unnamed protein product [Allacma fusca]
MRRVECLHPAKMSANCMMGKDFMEASVGSKTLWDKQKSIFGRKYSLRLTTADSTTRLIRLCFYVKVNLLRKGETSSLAMTVINSSPMVH